VQHFFNISKQASIENNKKIIQKNCFYDRKYSKQRGLAI
jgi:hypothetical protein